MRILFCNIAWMDYYKGKVEGLDEPKNGGSFVDKYKEAHESYNFSPEYLGADIDYPEGEHCLGFVETKSTNGTTRNQLKIESIDGCEALKNEKQVEDVLVIYCALYPDSEKSETYVVGWYRHATVFREYQVMDFTMDDGNHYYQSYNAIAKKEDCVLLPRSVRRRSNIWRVYRKSKGVSFGFGQANVWFANGRKENKELDGFLNRIVKQIEEYDGDNWIDMSVDGRRG